VAVVFSVGGKGKEKSSNKGNWRAFAQGTVSPQVSLEISTKKGASPFRMMRPEAFETSDSNQSGPFDGGLGKTFRFPNARHVAEGAHCTIT